MSETADTSRSVPPAPRNGGSEPPVHEAYSFACMRCGHGWEQAYEIRHHTDAQGRSVVTYYTDGRRVPSPLTTPVCGNCDGHVVRIMRSGQIPSAAAALGEQGIAGPLLSAAPMRPPVVTTESAEPVVPAPAAEEDRAAGAPHRRHFADLLHVFHRK
ncbi:hypothetical protein [Streptomyces sp. bgisy100]|uniref:hypothetical protein n=1 Tax=Streptomyces sp. bgisy100 TaxID=3413783 RepID=UPI003D718BE6